MSRLWDQECVPSTGGGTEGSWGFLRMVGDPGWWDVSKMVYCEIQEAHVFHISWLG